MLSEAGLDVDASNAAHPRLGDPAVDACKLVGLLVQLAVTFDENFVNEVYCPCAKEFVNDTELRILNIDLDHHKVLRLHSLNQMLRKVDCVHRCGVRLSIRSLVCTHFLACLEDDVAPCTSIADNVEPSGVIPNGTRGPFDKGGKSFLQRVNIKGVVVELLSTRVATDELIGGKGSGDVNKRNGGMDRSQLKTKKKNDSAKGYLRPPGVRKLQKSTSKTSKGKTYLKGGAQVNTLGLLQEESRTKVKEMLYVCVCV